MKKRLRINLATTIALLAAISVGICTGQDARPTIVEERLKRLEGEVEKLRKENADLRRELGAEGKAALVLVKPAGKEATLKLGGLLQAQADFGDKGDSRWATRNDSFLFAQRVSGVAWEGKISGQDARIGIGAQGFVSDDKSITGLGDFGFDLTPATAARDGVFEGYRVGGAADAQFRFGPFDLWVEYFRVRFKPANGVPAREFEGDGYYVQGSYFILSKKLQGVMKFESFDPNIDARGGSTDLWTIGVNYYLKGDDLKLQANYLLFDAAGVPDHRAKLMLRLQAMF